MSVSKNYILNIVMTITGILFPMITFPYISRILMPEYLGKVAFSQSISSYFITLSLLGIPIYSIRELSKNKYNQYEFEKVFTELIIIGLVGSLISFVFFQIMINNFDIFIEHKSLLMIFSVQIFLSFINIDYIFIVLENHKRRVIRSLILRGVSLFLMINFIKKDSDYIIYACIIIFPELLIKILDFYSVKKYLNFKINYEIKKHIKPLSILFLTTISISLYDQIDTTMIGIINGDEAVGLYSSAVKMSRILIPIIGALSTVIGPQLIYNIKEKNKKEIYKKIDIFLDFNFFIGFQMVFILEILSKNIIIFFAGEKYSSASSTMQVLLPIIIFISIGSFMGGRILTSNNLEKIPLRCNLIALFLNISMNFIFIPKYGILGAGISTVITEGINCILKSLSVKKLYKDYVILTTDRIKYITIGIIISVLIKNFKENLNSLDNFLVIVITGSIYICLYFFILLMFKDKIILKYLEVISEKLKNIKKKYGRSIFDAKQK
ncbi:flippase [Cetobacterium sp.]|uniref:flippase n=1 Tax=Cetobacterium sp. TaxID=2071632 RepID=UPI003EE5CA34